MSDSISQLQATVETLQRQILEMQAQIRDLHSVIRIDVDEDGKPWNTLQCHHLSILERGGRGIGATLSSDENGGYINILHKPMADGARNCGFFAGFRREGVPEIFLHAPDGTDRALISANPERGVMAVFDEEGCPAAVMQAQPGGGSVAVLQPDGKTRGVLAHTDTKDGGRTELIFADANASTVVKLLADPSHGILSLSVPGLPQATVLSSGSEGGSLMLKSPNEGASITLLATEEIAQIAAKAASPLRNATEISLMAGEQIGSSVNLHDTHGVRRASLEHTEDRTSLVLSDEEEHDVVSLAHYPNESTYLKLQSEPSKQGVQLLSTPEMNLLTVNSPNEATTRVSVAVKDETPNIMISEQNQGRVLITVAEQCGTVSAFGPSGEQGGMAALAGGERLGSVRVGTADGTDYAMLHANEHGGKLSINNDLGIQRIILGIHNEAPGLYLNNTGNPGVTVAAFDTGGIVGVHNAEGKLVTAMRGDLPPSK
ncbi:MAG: hypothetical protein JNJ83_01390 [Verrucomicrobiaceae bacterium]|nr:hypothetical protein [Verrucomicrobiaceae bacterium]